VTPVILASKLYQLESSMSAPDEIAPLLPFLCPRAIPIMLEYYVDQIPLGEITYLVLIGRLFDQLPSEISETVMTHTKELVLDADDLAMVIRHFWKSCLAAHASRSELAAQIKEDIGELFESLLARTGGWLASGPPGYQKPFLRLIRYCIRYARPWHIRFIALLHEGIEKCPHDELRCEYLRTYVDLLHRRLIPEAHVIRVDFLAQLLARCQATETIEGVYSLIRSLVIIGDDPAIQLLTIMSAV
jgi:hypothetical protein